MNVTIQLMAKAPQLGQVKTRLNAYYGVARVLDIYQCLLTEMIERCLSWTQCDTQHFFCVDHVALQLWVQGADHTFFDPYRRHVSVLPQVSGSLGARLDHSIKQALYGANKSDVVLVIGSDCLSVDRNYIASAIQSFCNDKTDIVLGPAEDGGYVLLGTRQECPGLFSNVLWGTSTVLSETLENARKEGLSLAQLATKWDIDTPADIERLIALESLSSKRLQRLTDLIA